MNVVLPDIDASLTLWHINIVLESNSSALYIFVQPHVHVHRYMSVAQPPSQWSYVVICMWMVYREDGKHGLVSSVSSEIGTPIYSLSSTHMYTHAHMHMYREYGRGSLSISGSLGTYGFSLSETNGEKSLTGKDGVQ